MLTRHNDISILSNPLQVSTQTQVIYIFQRYVYLLNDIQQWRAFQDISLTL